MPDIANLHDLAGNLAPWFAPVECFIIWLIWRKSRARPLPKWLKRARIFSAFDTLDRLDYAAGRMMFARQRSR